MRNRVIAGITRFPCYVKAQHATVGCIGYLMPQKKRGRPLGDYPVSSLQPPESVNRLLTIS